MPKSDFEKLGPAGKTVTVVLTLATGALICWIVHELLTSGNILILSFG